MRASFLVFVAFLGSSGLAGADPSFDVVLQGGRVIDPESGLDAVRNVGIQGDTIVRISAEPLAGKRMVDAGGLVVSPGFIELHQHAFLPETYPLLALDGVTTALELEVGASDFAPFLQAQDGRALIHYGASASLLSARLIAWDVPVPPSRFGAGAGDYPEVRARHQ